MPRAHRPSFDAPVHETGSWVAPVRVPPEAWREMTHALGRGDLAFAELTRIEAFLAVHAQHLRDERELKVSPEQVRATLAALASLPASPTADELRPQRNAMAREAHALLDAHSGSLPASAVVRLDAIYNAIDAIDGDASASPARHLARADSLTQALVAEQMHRHNLGIAEAAQRALAVGVPSTRGRNPEASFMAAAILVLWRELAGTEGTIATKEGYASPLVRFASVLFRVARAPVCDLPAVAARLRRARANSGKLI